MMDVVSVEQMRLSDAYTIKHLVPGKELMYRAAYGVYLAANWEGSIAIVTGPGNNGGDGYALGCILADNGIGCDIFALGDPTTDDSRYYRLLAEENGIRIRPWSEGRLDGYDMIVDCMLGTGTKGSPREPYRSVICEIGRTDAYVISVDINSGMNGDTGQAECAVRSDLTVTIGYVKKGLIDPGAGRYIKRLVCADIGIVSLSSEGIVSGPGERSAESSGVRFERPGWLDMDVIKAY